MHPCIIYTVFDVLPFTVDFEPALHGIQLRVNTELFYPGLLLQGQTLLMKAAATGKADIVQLILAAGGTPQLHIRSKMVCHHMTAYAVSTAMPQRLTVRTSASCLLL